MTRVSTANTYSNVLANLMRGQQRQDEAGNRVSSQKIGTDLKAFAGQAETLLATRSVQDRNDAYLEQGKALSAKLDAQDLAMNQAADSAKGARGSIAEAIAAGNGQTVMTALESWFSSATGALNTNFGGTYLFAGGQVDTQPVTASKMADLTAAPSTASLFKNDNLAAVNRIDDSTTVKTGFLASDLGTGLFDAFKQVQAYVDTNGDFSNPLTTNQQTFLEGMLKTFDTARVGLTNATAVNGLNQNRLDDATDQQTDRATLLKTVVGGIAGANLPEAISQLDQARTALQASAEVFTSLKGSSLLDYLR